MYVLYDSFSDFLGNILPDFVITLELKSNGNKGDDNGFPMDRPTTRPTVMEPTLPPGPPGNLKQSA